MLLSKEQLGNLIKKARKEKSKKIGKKFTQKDLGDALGKSRSYIGDIENGRVYPPMKLLDEIANICDAPYLVPINNNFYDPECASGNFLGSIPETKSDSDYTIYKDAFDKLSELNILLHGITPTDIKNPYTFNTPEDAIKFILKQPSIMGYGGFDISKLSDEEVIDFANELLNQLKILSYKYKK